MMHPRLPYRHHRVERRNLQQAWHALLGMAAALVIFMLVERTVVPRYSFATALDHAIPFIPLTWAIYVLFFPFVVLASACAQQDAFAVFKFAVVVAFGLSILCFQLFPEVVPRPDPALIDDAFLRQRLTRLWALDLASNGLPSLHVSVTCLAGRMLWITRYRLLGGATGVLICLSTLTVKQHTLVDVAGGVLLAVLCGVLVARWQRAGVSHGHA